MKNIDSIIKKLKKDIKYMESFFKRAGIRTPLSKPTLKTKGVKLRAYERQR